MGFCDIFLPKLFPQEISFRSGSVDVSEDPNLSIPAADLAALNAANWYEDPGRDAWDVANRHFDVLFFALYNPLFVCSMARHFRGAAVLRAYGLAHSKSYAELVTLGSGGLETVERLGRRFWFGAA